MTTMHSHLGLGVLAIPFVAQLFLLAHTSRDRIRAITAALRAWQFDLAEEKSPALQEQQH